MKVRQITKLLLQPMDAMFFGQGLPFSAGESGSSAGLPFPYPSTVYGALRSAYFSAHPEQLPLANKAADPTRYLRLYAWGLYNAKWKTPVFPAPLDLSVRKEQLVPLTLESNSDGLTSLPEELPYRFVAQDLECEAPANCWICDLDEYLKGRRATLLSASQVFLPEPKIGLARDNSTKTSAQGMLYQLPLLRFCEGIRFAAAFSGLEPEAILLRLGGQSRTCAVEMTDSDLQVTHGNIDNGCFKLYLSTPAIFSDGWLPSFIREGAFELCAACVGNAMPVSGWDMECNRPKPLRLAVPAGSVYYLRLKDNAPEARQAVLERFHGKAISDEDQDKKQGFGITYVGGWQA